MSYPANSHSTLHKSINLLSDFSFLFVLLTCSLILLSWMVVSGSGMCSDLEAKSVGDTKMDLHPDILRDEAVARLSELGKISDAENYLKRTFLSPASMKVGNLIRRWMEDAGLTTWMDQMGNVHGLIRGINASAGTLIIGSHLDTVVDAGIFDGSLGIISALSALKVLKFNGMLGKLCQPIEVIAFSDEEGVRFQSPFLGSGALAGTLPVSALQISDKRGVTLHDVLMENSIQITEEDWFRIRYDPKSVWGYVEVHIEQGPVLESLGLSLGVVKGIAGQTRLKVAVRGSQGHAGTVPMNMRQDPMAAAAELIVLLEGICRNPEEFLRYDGQCSGFSVESLVCTVGEISCWPSASNVIPGQVNFTVDVRALDDPGREAVIYEVTNQMRRVCERRSVSCTIERKHDANAVMTDGDMSLKLASAARFVFDKMCGGQTEAEVPVLISGAGHDAIPMSHLTKVGMLFVRCRGGLSHSPAEYVSDDDVWAAGLAVLAFLRSFT